MVNLIFTGQLGNNMFQYAAFWAYVKNNNIQDASACFSTSYSTKLLYRTIDEKYRLKPVLFKLHFKTVGVEGLGNFDEFPLEDNINIERLYAISGIL